MGAGVVYVANLVRWCTAPGWAGDNGQSCWSSECNLLTVARREVRWLKRGHCLAPATRGHHTAAVRVFRFLHRCTYLQLQYSEFTILSFVKAPRSTLLSHRNIIKHYYMYMNGNWTLVCKDRHWLRFKEYLIKLLRILLGILWISIHIDVQELNCITLCTL